MKASLAEFEGDRAVIAKQNKWLRETQQLIIKERNKKHQILVQQSKKENELTQKYDQKIAKINEVTDKLIADIDLRKKVFLSGKSKVDTEFKALQLQSELKKGLHEFLTRYMK